MSARLLLLISRMITTHPRSPFDSSSWQSRLAVAVSKHAILISSSAVAWAGKQISESFFSQSQKIPSRSGTWRGRPQAKTYSLEFSNWARTAMTSDFVWYCWLSCCACWCEEVFARETKVMRRMEVRDWWCCLCFLLCEWRLVGLAMEGKYNLIANLG